MVNLQEQEGIISPQEFIETIKFFDKNLVVGAELERTIPLERRQCAATFQTLIGNTHCDPTLQCRDARARSEFNIANVSSDGTIDYSNELIFSGNAEGFHWNRDKLKLIEDKISTMIREEFSTKTSTHISVLTATHTKLSPLILKNIFNIGRAYSAALFWLGSGNKSDRLIRGMSFCHSQCNINPAGKSAEALVCTQKYSHMNLSKQSLVSVGSQKWLNGLFIEFRNPDGIRVPSAVAALMMLHKAMAYKATEFSTSGLVSVESLSGDWAKNKAVMQRFGEAMSPDTHSCEFMAAEAHRLIELLSPYLKRMDEEVIPVLHKLADEPVSMRHRVKNIKEIEADLYVRKRSISNAETQLFKLILAGEVKADSFQAWKEAMSEELKCSVRWIEKMLNNIVETEKINFVFDEELKMMRID